MLLKFQKPCARKTVESIFTLMQMIISLLILGMGLLEGKDVKGAVNEIKNNFIAVYSVRAITFVTF